MPKVSVIVPVYNVEAYLHRCLESILHQTLEDIEIICVDDGSTDNSGKILDGFAGRDRRVRALHRPNVGYGAAMNAGLDAAAGSYIGIVESDDCIAREMYETLYDAAAADDLDLVKSDAYYWIERAAYRRRIHYEWLHAYYDRVLCDGDRNVFFDFYMNIWTGIYKKEFLTRYKIRFHESPGASYQDNGFWLQTFLYCRKAKWLSRAFYLYRQDNPAASVRSMDKVMAMTNEYEFLAHTLCGRKDYGFLSYCYYYKLLRHRGTLLRIGDDCKRSFCEQIRKDYAAYKGFVKGDVYLDAWLRGVTAEPDQVCGNMIREKAEIRERLASAEGIVIYGAGRRGDIIFRGLYNEGLYEKFRCFAVTKDPQAEPAAGKPVLTIREARERYPHALVILAVIRGSGIYHQMAGELARLGIDGYLDGTAIEENFYII